jgi:NADH dehydrogenase/NADH:ubiquinone oxidoreductase subunit G
MPSTIPNREPKTKAELLERILSHDFNGQWRDLSPSRATIERIASHTALIKLPESGLEFELTIHKRLTKAMRIKRREVYAKKTGHQRLSEEKRKELAAEKKKLAVLRQHGGEPLLLSAPAKKLSKPRART